MYLIVLPGIILPCSKTNLEQAINEILNTGVPVGKTPDGQLQVMKVKKEHIQVFDISNLQVSIEDLNIKESSILRAN